MSAYVKVLDKTCGESFSARSTSSSNRTYKRLLQASTALLTIFTITSIPAPTLADDAVFPDTHRYEGADGSDGGDGDNGSGGDDSSPFDYVFTYTAPDINSTADDTHGISVQLAGGDGGDGEGAGLFDDAGKGGPGGSGGNITATVGDLSGTLEVVTSGSRSHGVFLLSEGGNGGDGGGQDEGDIGGDAGEGRQGGNAGNIVLEVFGSVVLETYGDAAHGLFVKSVGGDGGDGGDADNFFSADGGDGGDGGASGALVQAVSHGFIGTYGDHSAGILAQSIGGHGGEAGHADSFFYSDPGDGGGGSAGEKVRVTNTGTILTEGYHAQGIHAQSIGGSGGRGGSSLGVVSLAGEGGAAGDGGKIEIVNQGVIITSDADSQAILAQSIGGSGGDGGYSTGALVAVGGRGGGAGNADLVTVDNTGIISTDGDRSHGVLAQSVGGGGGNAGGVLTAYAGLGSDGEAGGNGGSVTLSNTSLVTTAGDDANALFVQSVGGGGGSGSGVLSAGWAIGGLGGVGGSASAVSIDSSGDLATLGDRSYAILAQSIGGGGGSGGSAQGFASGTIGGKGGDGGHGGTVTVVNTAEDVATGGSDSTAILAQSIGGGGGNGGFAFGSGGFVNVSIGGEGGSGGNGDVVFVDNDGFVGTVGDRSHAIVAQSVGGGGGNGGGSVSLALGIFGAASVGLGGSGGDGGNGSSASIDNDGEITTLGENSYGLVTQSVGGGGGIGGGTLALAGSTGPIAGSVAVALGGSGGDGGDALNAGLTNTGLVTTYGALSHALVAQSVGGGGGMGGMATSQAIASAAYSASASVSLGGSGGSGGNAGIITVDNDGNVVTGGAQAYGILAQAIGGGGGVGGAAVSSAGESYVSATVSIGGSGGSGGEGGTVNVGNTGSVTTSGTLGHGILAQSIGGGGGAGGTASGEILDGSTIGIQVGVGGSGGVSGSGGLVTITNTGSVETSASMSHAIFAQSIGGGGGIGGGSSGTQGDTNYGGTINIGGVGGASGSGGSVTIDNAGSVITHGTSAYGIAAQSIGGAGGTGGYVDSDADETVSYSGTTSVGGFGGNAGDGSLVDIDHSGSVITEGLMSHAIFAQSIGGGGGAGLFASADGATGNIMVGGEAGAAGNGGAVDINLSGTIMTLGDGAFGIFAQSIGGGGGLGGGTAGGAFYESSSVAGAGGAGGDGGDISITNAGNIMTFGKGSFGIFAQSIGGGGGIAGFVEDDSDFGAHVNGAAGSDGDGGDITVTNTGAITTYGDGAHAIFVQSVGGGGGVSGSVDGADGLIGSASGEGSAGTVTVVQTGDITTEGKQAHGIFIQSAAGIDGGLVNLTYEGDILVSGENSHAVFVQSDGASANGDYVVDLNGTVATGGSGTSAGFMSPDGANGTLNNYTTLSALSGTAVQGGTGNDAVDNHEVIIGNVDLAGGANSFLNRADAIFLSSDIAFMGAGNTLTNEGIMTPGGEGVIQTTLLTGNFVQTSTGDDQGTLIMDVKYSADPSDLIDVTGTANVGGYVAPRLQNLQYAGSVAIVSTGAGAVADDLEVDEDFVGVDYDTSVAGNDVLLELIPAFERPTHTHNQRAVGAHFNDILNNGGSAGLAPLFTLAGNIQDEDELAAFLDRLHPEPYLAAVSTSYQASQAFTQDLLSCPEAGEGGSLNNEGECYWARANHRYNRQYSNNGFIGFDENASSLSGGFQKSIGTNLFAGFSAGVDFNRTYIDDRADMKGVRLMAGGVLKYEDGPLLLAGALSGGAGWFDMDRYVDLPTPGLTAESRINDAFATVDMRAAYTISNGAWHVKPILDVSATHVHLGSFSETGAGAQNLVSSGTDEIFFNLRPSLEIGGLVTKQNGTSIHGFVRAGLLYSPDTEMKLSASFEGTPANVAPFEVESKFDNTFADLSAGLYLNTENGVTVRFGYDGLFSANSASHRGSIKVSSRF